MARRQGRQGSARAGLETTAEVTPNQQVEVPVNPQEVIIPSAAPDILIDGISGVSVINGIVRLSLSSVRQVTASDQKPVLIARLCLSISSFVNLYDALTKLMVEFEKNGVVVRNPS